MRHSWTQVAVLLSTTLLSTPLLSTPLSAQEQGNGPALMVRGEAHEQLDRLAGTWKTQSVMRFNGQEFIEEGTETYEWIEPTRVWLRKEVSSDDHPILGEMNGFEYWSYDADAGEYVNYWFDNQSPETFSHRGTWADENRLVMTGMIVWKGREMHLKNVLEFDGPDRFVWRHSQSWDMDDAFEERSTVVYTRTQTAATGALTTYREHLASLTNGIWITSNASYRDEDGGIDEYGMAYTLQPSGVSATGCLWVIRDGQPDGIAWQFLLAWDPDRQAGMVYQSNAAGFVAKGYMEARGPGEPELVQRLWAPDGTVTRIGHVERMDGTDRRVSQSLEWSYGSWSTRRSYTWVRERDRSGPCQPVR